MKKTFTSSLKSLLFPSISEEVKTEIDMLNVTVLKRITFLCAVMESVALIIIAIGGIKTDNIKMSIISTAFAAVLCLIMNTIMRAFDKKKYYNHIAIVTICNSFSVLFIAWSMFVSARRYMAGFQVITFYVIVVALISFTVMLPKISISLVTVSFICFYIFMYWFNEAAGVHAFYYLAFMLICCACSVEKCTVTIGKIEEKIKTEELNKAYIRIMRHDPLSKLKNRNALIEDLQQFCGNEIVVFIFDLDSFKKINDKYGHISGDRVIAAYAQALTEIFDEESVYRFGGDEFLAVKHAITEEELVEINEELHAVPEHIQIEGIDEKTNFSWGISKGIIENSSEFEKLVVNADQKLYDQKSIKHRI